MSQLTNAEMTALHKLGWEFLPYGPSEWMWIKLDTERCRIASECDSTWARDLREIRGLEREF